MASYKDIVLNSGEYIPQYTGSALSEIQQTGNVLAGRHYQNIADMSALELALKHMQAQAPEGARPYIADQVNQVSQELQNLSRNGAENSTAKVAALNNAFRGDQGLLRVGINAQRIKELEKNIQDAKGNALYNKEALELLKKAPVYTTDAEGNQIMHQSYANDLDTHVETEADVLQDYKRIADELTPNLVQTFADFVELKNGRLAFKEAATKKLDKKKIVDQMGEYLKEAYRESPSYKQGIKYKISGRDKDENATQGMIDYALLKMFEEDHTRIQPLGGSGDDGSGNTKKQKPTTIQFNYGQVDPKNLPDYKKSVAETSELETQLKNLEAKGKNYTSQPAKEEHTLAVASLKQQLSYKKAYQRKAQEDTERELKASNFFDTAWSQYTNILNQVTDKEVITRGGEELLDGKGTGKFKELPKSKEEFIKFVRSLKQYGSPTLNTVWNTTKAAQHNKQNEALDVLQKTVLAYEDKLTKKIKQAEKVTMFSPIVDRKDTDIANLTESMNKLWTDSNTSFTDVGLNNIVSKQDLRQELEDQDLQLVDEGTELQPAGVDDFGRPVFQLSYQAKPKEGTVSRNFTKNVVPQDLQKGLDNIKATAEIMMQSERPLTQQRGQELYKDATMLPLITQNNFELENVGDEPVEVPNMEIKGAKVKVKRIIDNDMTYYTIVLSGSKGDKELTYEDGHPVAIGDMRELGRKLFDMIQTNQ